MTQRAVAWKGRRYFTRNLVPGHRVYGERITRMRGDEYREWSARRSKLAAYMASGGRRVPMDTDLDWLYLGAASGTTVSHVSDMVPDGRVVAVEFGPRPFRDLLDVARRRPNLFPILADANRPGAYAPLFDEPADVVYQDIAQRDQDRIFLANIDRLLSPDGIAFLAVKARSVDVAAAPKDVYSRIAKTIEEAGARVAETRPLDEFQKDHGMLVVEPQVRRR